MKRLLAFSLAVSLVQASVVFAAGPESAAGPAPAANAVIEKAHSSARTRFISFAEAARVGVAPAQTSGTLAQQGGAGTISQSGMSKRTKTMILAAVAVGFLGTAYGIDHKVKDVTPSSLGTRHDNDVFNK
jgi:hypothetical protein